MCIYKCVDVVGGIRRRPPLNCRGVLHMVLKFREIFEFSLRLFDFASGSEFIGRTQTTEWQTHGHYWNSSERDYSSSRFTYTPTAQRKLQNVDRSSRWSAMEPFCLWFVIIIITGGNFKGNSLLHGDWQHRVTHRRIKRTGTKKSWKFPITCQQMQFECHHRWYSILLKSGSGWISYFFSATDREEEILSMGLCFVTRARACYLFLINEINEHQRSSNYYPLAIIICDNKDNSWFRFRVLWCEFCVIRVYSFWCDQFGEELLVNVQPAHYVPVPHRTVEPVLIKLEKGFKNNKDEWNGNRRNNNLNILLGTDRWNICRCMN